jgi:predicted GIY-YIG superfamily endonuclease
VTSDLVRRVYEHRENLVPGFTKRYGCKLLVWYEQLEDIATAIVREKQIKAGSRKKKLALIEAMNPQWRDLWKDLVSPWIASPFAALRARNDKLLLARFPVLWFASMPMFFGYSLVR